MSALCCPSSARKKDNNSSSLTWPATMRATKSSNSSGWASAGLAAALLRDGAVRVGTSEARRAPDLVNGAVLLAPSPGARGAGGEGD